MQAPLKIDYRGVEKTGYIDNYIRRKAAGLEKVCDFILHAHVAVEKYQQRQQTGNPYRVRVYIAVPHEKEIVVDRLSKVQDRDEPLITTIRKTFRSAEIMLKALVERQRGNVKRHPADHEVTAVVDKIFPREGYGFLKALDGHQVYFHKNAVLHGHFDRLRIGSGVRFVETMGEEGPQASTVEPVDIRGTHVLGGVHTGAEAY